MPKKILVIDDEADFLKVTMYRLKARGYEVMTASNGKDGVDAVRSGFPDLILLDLRLPDMTGIEVAKVLHDGKGYPKPPIMIITASTENISEKIKESTAVDYLSKPIDPQEMYEKIEKYILK